jgi:hypothetical protein
MVSGYWIETRLIASVQETRLIASVRELLVSRVSIAHPTFDQVYTNKSKGKCPYISLIPPSLEDWQDTNTPR